MCVCACAGVCVRTNASVKCLDIGSMSRHLICGLIRQFRTKQCRKDPTNGDQCNIMMAPKVEGNVLLRAFIETVIAEGGVLHSGMGPSTGLERDCQHHIEELNSVDGDPYTRSGGILLLL